MLLNLTFDFVELFLRPRRQSTRTNDDPHLLALPVRVKVKKHSGFRGGKMLPVHLGADFRTPAVNRDQAHPDHIVFDLFY